MSEEDLPTHSSMIFKNYTGGSMSIILKGLRSRNLPLHLMILPGVAFLVIFAYIPMAGIIMAFQDFNPARGFLGNQEWVGFENFSFVINHPHTLRALSNTLLISSMKIILGLAVPITFAILLNELRSSAFRRTIQTIIYLPHFLSWVIFAGLLINILSPERGIVNNFLEIFGIEPIFFLGDNSWFPATIIFTDIWKGFGFGTIVYLAAITSIDVQLYEAAIVDGATRFQQVRYVTLLGMRPIIALMAVLSLGGLLSAGFDQIFNLYSPQVYESGDIIDTFVYRTGLVQAQFSLAAAVDLIKGLVSLALIGLSYYLAYKFTDYRIF